MHFWYKKYRKFSCLWHAIGILSAFLHPVIVYKNPWLQPCFSPQFTGNLNLVPNLPVFDRILVFHHFFEHPATVHKNPWFWQYFFIRFDRKFEFCSVFNGFFLSKQTFFANHFIPQDPRSRHLTIIFQEYFKNPSRSVSSEFLR